MTRKDFELIASVLANVGDSTARRVTIAAADGITNLRQHALDSGIPQEELP